MSINYQLGVCLFRSAGAAPPKYTTLPKVYIYTANSRSDCSVLLATCLERPTTEDGIAFYGNVATKRAMGLTRESVHFPQFAIVRFFVHDMCAFTEKITYIWSLLILNIVFIIL